MLYEIYNFLEAIKFSDLRVIINKIYAGQNNLLHIILKQVVSIETIAEKQLNSNLKEKQEEKTKFSNKQMIG